MSMETELREAVRTASARADVRNAVAEVYAALGEAIDIRRPICKTSGRCCGFEEFGHRLYVTTMELAKFMADLSVVRSQLSVAASSATTPSSTLHLPILAIDTGQLTPDRPGCPFQVEGLCGVHAFRPFGCRIFFCDETSTAWQQEMYERLHGQIRNAHEALGVPYYYVEWRFALRSLGLVNS